MRHDITEEHAAREVLEKEVSSLLVQLHQVQLQLHSKSEMQDSDSIRAKLVSICLTGISAKLEIYLLTTVPK